MEQLKFGEAVEHKGQTAIIVGVRGAATAVLVDLLKVREVRNGADLVQNVIGTARQVELVRFEHDVPAEEIERAEDWFFSLNAPQLDALLKEKYRRDHEKLQAEQAKADQVSSAALLQDVKIRPSDRVLQTAQKLWKDAVRAEQHADEHEEIELPSFESKPDLWKPWIDQAKSLISMQDRSKQAEAGGQIGRQTEAASKGPLPVETGLTPRPGGGFFNTPLPSAKERDQAEQAKAAGRASVVACNKCGETVQDDPKQALGHTHINGSGDAGANCGGTFVEMSAEEAAKLNVPKIVVKGAGSIN